MEKTLATVTIKIGDTVGSSGTHDGGDGNFTITVNPSDLAETRKQPDFFQTTLAHELGHVVSLITKDKSHDNMDLVLSKMFGPQMLIPAEAKAWKIAHQIHPTLNPAIERADMATYGVK